jgi:hypothetical protein
MCAEDRILKSGIYATSQDLASSGTTIAVLKIANEAGTLIDGKTIEESVRGFAESSKVLMSALDQVAKIHPFVAGQ